MSKNTCDLEILTFNVRGLADFSKRNVFDFLRCQSADIICLQELHVAPGKENMFRNQWGGRAYLVPVSSGAGGIGILIKNNVACKSINFITNEKGSVMILSLDVNGVKVKIANVYGPPARDDPSFFEEVFKLTFEEQQDHVILCGDWNFSLNPEIDTYNYVSRDRRTRSRELVRNKCTDLNLHDVWRLMNGERRQFTWRKGNPVKCARLDFFLVTESILSKCLSCEILPAYRSDHSRVSIRLNLSSQSRGKGLWKLNCSLLKELAYIRLVKQCIQDTVYTYACPIYSHQYIESHEAKKDLQMTISDDLFLETLLMNIRSETISYTVKRAKERTEKERQILLSLQELELLSRPSQEDIENIRNKQAELQSIRSAANEGRIIRSRAKWYEEGEKGSSSYFLTLEKRNFESKLIPCLNIEDRVVKDSEEILVELTKHYDSLYKRSDAAENSEINEYLESTQIPKLDNSELQSLEKEITVEELGETLKRFSNNKSPGSDGFPYEFFKVFWCDLKYFVFKSLNYGLKRGELSITQREGIITLVPKPGKPRNVISSWRPITLLNSTYKILAGTFANRMKKVLDSIIHADQTAFLKNRFIGENIRATYDVLLETYLKKQEGLMLSIDFKTAFDVMSWNFLECCLKKFNFGPNFIKTFWCLHMHCFSRIIYNANCQGNV